MTEDVRQQLIALLPRLRRFAYSLTGSLDAADDVLQTACERALSRSHQWQPGTRLDSWMFRIMQTVWIDWLRAQAVRGATIDLEVAERSGATGVWSDNEAGHTLELVIRAMQQLPEEQRIIIALISVDGLSYRETAAALDIPVGTVMSRLARARRRLYEMINSVNSGPDAQRGGKSD